MNIVLSELSFFKVKENVLLRLGRMEFHLLATNAKDTHGYQQEMMKIEVDHKVTEGDIWENSKNE